MEVSGFQLLAASGAVGTSGKPVIVTGYAVTAGGGATTPYFRNGTGVSSATAFAASTAGTGLTVTEVLSPPVMLPLGCYVSFETNTVAVTVFFNQGLT